MLIFDPFVFCTNNYPGEDLCGALDMAVRCGFRRVEIAAIDGMCEQVNADTLTDADAETVRSELEKRGLTCRAVSGHCDMTDERAFRRLLKKIRFAGAVGARCLNTRCGPRERYDVFSDHLKEAAALAASYGMDLNLESYGDIVGPACEAAEVFASLELPNVRYNYDPGNTYRFRLGQILIEEDLADAAIVPAYLHLKDGAIRDGILRNTPIGAGAIDWPAVFRVLERRAGTIPCALEVPQTFAVELPALKMRFLQPGVAHAEQVVRDSVDYLKRRVELRY